MKNKMVLEEEGLVWPVYLQFDRYTEYNTETHLLITDYIRAYY
jgi:hypothetical protein